MPAELAPHERRRLAAAIRGPMERMPVSAASLERRLQSLPPDVRAVLVEAFARKRAPGAQLRLF